MLVNCTPGGTCTHLEKEIAAFNFPRRPDFIVLEVGTNNIIIDNWQKALSAARVEYQSLLRRASRVAKVSIIQTTQHRDGTYTSERERGLMDKIVTGPLWRSLNEKGHLVEMNDGYLVMQRCFSRWSKDSSQFMVGNYLLFNDIKVHTDEIYQSLVSSDSDLDSMTRQILELLFTTFCQVTEKILSDHLPSGTHVGMSEQKMKETVSVPRHNVGVERDFGMLDRLMRLKPSASTLVYKGIMMNVRNRTSEWRKGLTEREREEYLEYSRRKKVASTREEYARRAKILWDNRETQRKDKNQIALEKEEKKHVQMQKEYASVRSKCGGIWLTESEVASKLQGVNEKESIGMLKAQLQARKHVLGEKKT